MWNNISSKIKQWLVSAKEWFAIVKKWVILRKDWVIIGVAGVLAIALVVGVILVIVDKTSGDDPVQDTTTGIQMEATDQTYDTGEETVSQSGAEDTTAASMSEETTAPEETTGEADPTTEGTKPVEKDPLQDGNGSAGTGFTDQAPQGPSTSVTPSTPEIPDETAPPPTETMAPEKPVQEYTYKEYMALASSEKTKFFYAFPSLGDFNRWYNAAKKAYDEEKLVIGDSNIDLDELLNP